MRAVQILAAPAEAQIGHYPAFVSVGDELALDFRDACRLFLAAAWDLTEEQARALAQIDQLLDDLGGSDSSRSTADRDAVRNDPRWHQVRVQAAAVLDTFGWQNELPLPSNTVYVAVDRKTEDSFAPRLRACQG
jgi:hypothetical protein